MTNVIDMRNAPQLDRTVGDGSKFTALPSHWRGRGSRSNDTSRYDANFRSLIDDGWDSLGELPALKTSVFEEHPKSIITRNQSPDISFDRSINPYRGCEHGCTYCYARPSHAYMGLSPGLDFESKLFVKPNAAALLREELTAPNYKPATIMLGANTDPYQPIERTYRISRQVLEVLSEFNHPVGIVTKSALVTRDVDILSSMAERGLVKIAISVTSLDGKLARAMEPRASAPAKRLEALRVLSSAGVPTVAMVAPIIPGLNDMEIDKILKAVSLCGTREASYVMLRLPLEVRDLFQEWLQDEFPDRAAKVMSLVRDVRDGKDYDAKFGKRMTGTGVYAWTTGRRFQLASERLGFNKNRLKLRTDLFKRPPRVGEQMSLFA